MAREALHIPVRTLVVSFQIMCERLVIPEQEQVEREFHLARPWWKFSASFNVPPVRRNVPAIRLYEGESEGVMMRWGLIPDWAEGDPTRACAIHAKAEELSTSALFRGAWMRRQRCILPAAGFYEWQLTKAGYRQPYFVRLVNRMAFGLAAIWDRSVVEEDDDVIESCALITVPANPLMREIHNTGERMPAILAREDYEAWLTLPPEEAAALLRPFPQERMVAHPVSPRVNSLRYDDPWLIRPVEQPAMH